MQKKLILKKPKSSTISVPTADYIDDPYITSIESHNTMEEELPNTEVEENLNYGGEKDLTDDEEDLSNTSYINVHNS